MRDYVAGGKPLSATGVVALNLALDKACHALAEQGLEDCGMCPLESVCAECSDQYVDAYDETNCDQDEGGRVG